MACIYILKLCNGQYYVGSTNDLLRRLKDHNNGRTASIKYKLPAKLIFAQEFDSLKEARQVEYKIKTYKDRDFIEKIVKKGIIEI